MAEEHNSYILNVLVVKRGRIKSNDDDTAKAPECYHEHYLTM
jgi:hypothetical protein